MDLKVLEKELRGTKAPFQKVLKIGKEKLVIQVNEKKEVYVMSDLNKYKFILSKCNLTEKKLRDKRHNLSQFLSDDELEKALQEYIDENITLEYTNTFPNIKQFMLMLKRVINGGI